MNHRNTARSLLGAACLVGTLSAGTQAELVTRCYSITFDGGWRVEGTVVYDDSVTIASGAGADFTDGIDYLDSTFFNSAGDELYSFVTVNNGFGASSFFAAQIDTAAGEFVPDSGFDFGPDTPIEGAYFTAGTIGRDGRIVLASDGAVDQTSDSSIVLGACGGQGIQEFCYESVLDGGWRVWGLLVYDASLPVVSASGLGPTNGIDRLKVNFEDPFGNVVYSTNNVLDGESNNGFLEFQFDTATKDMVPGALFDMGDPTNTGTDYYYNGTQGGLAEVFQSNVGVRDSTQNAQFTQELKPCNPADIAAPLSVLDLADTDLFITAFQSGNFMADLAAPFGLIDLSDVDTFIQNFLAGCP